MNANGKISALAEMDNFTYFDELNLSADGYYYKEIEIDNPDAEFISAMFTANNMQAGQKLSLEVLCSNIVVYLPMNEVFAELIKENNIYDQQQAGSVCIIAVEAGF